MRTNRIIIITTCTGRKKISKYPPIHASNLPMGEQCDVLFSWKKLLIAQEWCTAARDVYCGRGFFEILKTTSSKDEDLFVISAGLGLIHHKREIPSYNLTISPSSPDSIQSRIIPGRPFDVSLWWSNLNKELHNTCTPLADLIRENSDSWVIISLSRPYAEMVLKDLSSLEVKYRKRLRILGLTQPSIDFEPLQEFCMPYDERFDGPDSVLPGTRSDFPQRVTSHFVENILNPTEENATTADHSRKVSDFLKGKRAPILVKREQNTDEQIRQIILRRWSDARDSSAVMLRLLRDEEKIACEQKRFSQLFKAIKVVKNG